MTRIDGGRRELVLLTAAVLLALAASSPAAAQPPADPPPDRIDVYANPLDVSLGDPQILKDGGTYYLYGTSNPLGFEVWSSTDMVSWRKRGLCWQTSPTTWAKGNFWAPEAIRVGDRYYLFYTGSSNSSLRVCVASADSPLGPFIDLAAPMLGSGVNHFDPSPLYDSVSGRVWLYWTKDTVQSGSDHSEIWCGRMKPNMTGLDNAPVLCLSGSQEWERAGTSVFFIEGPNVMRRGSMFYMQYSGNAWNTPNYGLGLATATSPAGPWTKRDDNPFLGQTGPILGPGHGCFALSPDGTETYVVYHSLLQSGSWNRQLNIDRVCFYDEGSTPTARLALFSGPTRSPQLLPAGAAVPVVQLDDEFTAPLDRNVWEIMSEDPTAWSQTGGRLSITPRYGTISSDRIDGQNVFLKYAPFGDFRVETKLAFVPQVNQEQARLLIFQDQNNYISISRNWVDGYGFLGSYLFFVRERDGSTTQDWMDDPVSGSDIYFRIAKTGTSYVGQYSADGATWTSVGAAKTADFPGPLQVGVAAFTSASPSGAIAEVDYVRVEVTQPESLWDDEEFNGATLDRHRWVVHHEVPGEWAIGGGALAITTAQGDFWTGRDDARNLFLRRAPEEDFFVRTRVSFAPRQNYEQALLMVWRDHNNYAKLSTVYDNGPRLEAAIEIDGVYSNESIENTFGSDLVLGIERREDRIRFLASGDGSAWTPVGWERQNPWPSGSGVPPRIGVGAEAPESGTARTAHFDWFRLDPPAPKPSCWMFR